MLLHKNPEHICMELHHNVTGPPGALLFDVKPEIALKESLELQFCLTCCLFDLAFIVQISCNSCHI